jgi:hypothetical protein
VNPSLIFAPVVKPNTVRLLMALAQTPPPLYWFRQKNWGEQESNMVCISYILALMRHIMV